MGCVDCNSVGGFNDKEAWVSKEKISISAMARTREYGDEDTWVLLFTTTKEEGGDGHRYGDMLVLSCPLSFKTKVEERLTILRWSRRKIDSSMMEIIVKCQSSTTKVIHGQLGQSRSTRVNQGL